MVTRAAPNAALILIDFQLGLCRPPAGQEPPPLAAAVAEHGVLAAAHAALTAMRAHGGLVAHVHLAFAHGYANRTNRTARFDDHEAAGRFAAGSESVQFCPEVAPADAELVFAKGSVGPFASTPLERALRARGVGTLFICGVATQLAVESMTREGADRGFEVVVLGDACAAPSAEFHEHAINKTIPLFAEVVDTTELRRRLAG
jgi:nicotinamidase-related amidase